MKGGKGKGGGHKAPHVLAVLPIYKVHTSC